MSLTNALTHLFSPSGIGWLFVGMAGTRFYYWVKMDWWNRHHPDLPQRRLRFNSLVILWALIFIFFIYQGAAQQKTANDVSNLAIRTAECQRQFFGVLKARSDANDETDSWSAKKTEAIANWMHEITFPPDSLIPHREVRDEVYQQWLWDTTGKYFALINQADKEQKAALKQRAELQLPDPTCVK